MSRSLPTAAAFADAGALVIYDIGVSFTYQDKKTSLDIQET